jgi:hypothetical protein
LLLKDRKVGEMEMADRITVMSWLEGLAQDDWRMFHSDSEVQEIARSALALLKEQEAKTGHWILDPDGMDWNIPAWKCSECGNRHNGLPTIGCDEMNIYRYAGSRFCPNCGTRMEGRAVKWGES